MLPLRDASPPRRTPVVTATILVLCAAAFGLEVVLLVQGGDAALNGFLERHGLVPADLVGALRSGTGLPGQALDLLTHLFLHASWLHLMGNALFLWIFAPNLEDRLGRLAFLGFYLVGGLAAAAGQVLSGPGLDQPMIGASGAISAVLGAYFVLFPRARIQSLVFLGFFYELIAVPSVLVLGFWFGLQLIDAFASLGLTAEASGGIAFWAHVGGFLAGAAMAILVRLLRPAPVAGVAVTGAPARPTVAGAIALPPEEGAHVVPVPASATGAPVQGPPPPPPARPASPPPPPPPRLG